MPETRDTRRAHGRIKNRFVIRVGVILNDFAQHRSPTACMQDIDAAWHKMRGELSKVTVDHNAKDSQ